MGVSPNSWHSFAKLQGAEEPNLKNTGLGVPFFSPRNWCSFIILLLDLSLFPLYHFSTMEFYYTDTSFLRSYRYVTQEAVLHVYRHWTSVARLSSLDQCWACIVIGSVLSVYRHWASAARVSSLDQWCTCIVIRPAGVLKCNSTREWYQISIPETFPWFPEGIPLHLFHLQLWSYRSFRVWFLALFGSDLYL
jgi:hypothetical protein